jgi:hypothetical protein
VADTDLAIEIDSTLRSGLMMRRQQTQSGLALEIEQTILALREEHKLLSIAIVGLESIHARWEGPRSAQTSGVTESPTLRASADPHKKKSAAAGRTSSPTIH